MNNPQIESMIKSIDIFYDKKQKLSQQLESGSISLCQYRRENSKLDEELDKIVSSTEYNENEEHTLHELKQFSQQ